MKYYLVPTDPNTKYLSVSDNLVVYSENRLYPIYPKNALIAMKNKNISITYLKLSIIDFRAL